MISGKIILKSATKLSLDQRFTEIAKHAPTTSPRIQQQANVIIPYSRQELFGNKRKNLLSIAQRLKKRSINYRLGLGPNPNANRLYKAPTKPRIFQRLSYGNRRRFNAGGNNSGANRFLFGGQSGMGIRLRGQGRIREKPTFRARTRGYLNNNYVSRYGGFSRRGNMNNRGGRRFGNNNNFNRFNRGRFGPNSNRGGRGRGGRGRGRGSGRGSGRGRGRNNNNEDLSKEILDNDLEKYMQQTKIENDSIEMNAI